MKPVATLAKAVAASVCFGFLFTAVPASAADPAQIPTICVSSVDANNLVVAAHIRSGFSAVVLETRNNVDGGLWTSYVSGAAVKSVFL